jgi:hypothetical protein
MNQEGKNAENSVSLVVTRGRRRRRRRRRKKKKSIGTYIHVEKNVLNPL